jgi:hypothetical protein
MPESKRKRKKLVLSLSFTHAAAALRLPRAPAESNQAPNFGTP